MADKKLRGLFFISMIYMFTYQLIFIKEPTYYQWQYELGKIFNDLALGYNISYIFYLLIRLRDEEEKSIKLKTYTTPFF